MGGFVGSLFGGGNQASIDVPETTLAPSPEEIRDPEAKAVREIERRRILAKRAMNGTLLSGIGELGNKLGIGK